LLLFHVQDNLLIIKAMFMTLFEPDIPQNMGSMIRLAACMDVPLHIIEPCGFPFDDRRMRRVAMDYYDATQLQRHSSWQKFIDYQQERRCATSPSRLVLLTTRATLPYTEFTFMPDDALLFGRESSGVPEYVRQACDNQVRIPVHPGVRSLNLVQAASMVLGEALRQTKRFPGLSHAS
jgi:tRNA (cytidine/uridine-2'-O-)-methyltransferase